MCSRFVTGMCNQLFDDDELCFRASGIAQMFQYSETILVLPVAQYSAQKEDGNILLLRRLWVEEVVALGTKCKLSTGGDHGSEIRRTLYLYATRSKRVGHVFLPKLLPISRQTYVIFGGVSGFGACTSTASPTTDSRSWTTKRRCGCWVASASDCVPTPPPTSTTSEPSGIFSQVSPAMIPRYQRQMMFFKSHGT